MQDIGGQPFAEPRRRFLAAAGRALVGCLAAGLPAFASAQQDARPMHPEERERFRRELRERSHRERAQGGDGRWQPIHGGGHSQGHRDRMSEEERRQLRKQVRESRGHKD